MLISNAHVLTGFAVAAQTFSKCIVDIYQIHSENPIIIRKRRTAEEKEDICAESFAQSLSTTLQNERNGAQP